MKVLVVDDNCTLASAIRAVLEDQDTQVISAKDGVEGYSAYLDFRPDIVITDIQMPRRSGVEMVHRIRNHNPLIKTIYMSGNMGAVRPFLCEEAKRYPVSFFEKPFSLESLKKEVERSRVHKPAAVLESKQQTCVRSIPEKKDRHLSWQPRWVFQE